MEKIPTLFERDWDGDRSRVVNKVNPIAQWLIDEPKQFGLYCTEKLDGTSCMIHDDFKLYGRYTLRVGKNPPPGFIAADDMDKGKQPGWRPLDDRPEDRFAWEAYSPALLPGTYELTGPKIQGNPYGLDRHVLRAHNDLDIGWVDPDWAAAEAALVALPIEGLVWQLRYPEGGIVKAVKIKRRDFGIAWPLQ